VGASQWVLLLRKLFEHFMQNALEQMKATCMNPRSRSKLKAARSCLGQLVLAGSIALPYGLAAARENSPALEIARQLNQAFVEVAEAVSPAVVVIEVSHASDYFDADEDNPLLEMIPPEFRKEFHERLEKRRSERKENPDGPPRRRPIADSRGSGVVLRKDGYILTNSHVVEGAEEIRVRFKDGRRYAATVRGVDPQSDIAVIKIDADDLVTARMGDSSKARVGEFTIAIGAPFDLDYSVTFGHVSAKGRTHVVPSFGNSLGAAMDQDFIQTDASINPGNSGGPLVNIDSEVIGINTLIRGLNTGIGFAVPINLAKSVADHLISEGKFKRAWLGVSVMPFKDYAELRGLLKGVEDGVVVDRIDPRGPAFKSELKQADVITAVEGIKVTDAQELRSAVRSKELGSMLTLDVIRESKPLKIKVQSEEWPEETLAISVGMRKAAGERSSQILGLTVHVVTKELAKKFGIEPADGVVVIKVEEDSPAAERGLRDGDIISAVNHKAVTTPKQFREAVKDAGSKGVILKVISAAGGVSEVKILKDQGE